MEDKIYEAYESFCSISKVPVINCLPEPLDFHKKYVHRSTPVIVKNGWNQLLEQTGVKNGLTHDTLKDDETSLIDVSVTPNGWADAIGRLDINKNPENHKSNKTTKSEIFLLPEQTSMTFPELYQKLSTQTKTSSKFYYYQKQNSSLTIECDNLLKSNKVPESVPFADKAFENLDAINIWLGSSESVSSIHKDPYENIYCVVEGKKQFSIAPPVLMPWMGFKDVDVYKHKLDGENWGVEFQNYKTQWIDGFDESKVRLMNVAVEKGDLFYLPAFWFHQVEQDDFTLAVNYWYDYDFLNPNYLLIDALSPK